MIKALIAVRSGSVRVKDKNIKPFYKEKSLLELKIRQLQKIRELDGIVVNSNDDQMLALANDLGTETVKRDHYFATNYVSMSEVYVNMAKNVDTDIIMYANVTNPCVSTRLYEEAIELFLSSKEKDSLTTVTDVKEFLWLDGKPMNYEIDKQPRSQDLPHIVKLNFAISILPKKMMIERKNVVGSNPYLFNLSEEEAIDIDTELDFRIAQYIYAEKMRQK